MEKISKFVTLKEAIKSQTAVRKSIDNSPVDEHLPNMVNVATKIYDVLCEHFKIIIPITSFYRSPKLNTAIGGSKTSQHSKGQAIDVDMDMTNSNITNADVFNYIKDNLEFDQLIWEFGDDSNPAWVHFSLATKNRKQVLKAKSVNGKTVYQSF